MYEETLDSARVVLAPWSATMTEPEPNRLNVTLPATDLLSAVISLTQAHWGYLSAITGLDLGLSDGLLEVLYHFCGGPNIITLRVHTPRAAPVVPSLCALLPSASVFERELIEMLGVTVTDTPDPSRLFLPDDWPPNVYPLRKDALLTEV